MSNRISPFDTDDLSDFRTEPAPSTAVPVSAEAIDQLSHQTGFPSRPFAQVPSVAAPIAGRPRRYTTGRDKQLNVKVEGRVKERFLALADVDRIPLGALFEKMLDAYERERGKGG